MAENLAAEIRRAGNNTVIVEPETIQIGIEQFDTDVFVILGGDYIEEKQTEISKLGEYCRQEQKPICIIGYTNEITDVEELVPKGVVAETVVRPYETKPLVDRLMQLCEMSREPIVKGQKILLIDDDTQYLKTVLVWLQRKYDVTAVRAGTHALKFLKDHTADLILLDQNMPVMSGTETLEKLRAKSETANIPVIFLSGSNDKQHIMEAMQMHPAGYLLKTMGKDDLVHSVEQFFISQRWKPRPKAKETNV